VDKEGDMTLTDKVSGNVSAEIDSDQCRGGNRNEITFERHLWDYKIQVI